MPAATGPAVAPPPAPPAEGPLVDPATLDDDARQVLRRLTAREDAVFREDQLEAVRALLVDRARVLVVQRTGWGKSAVYFVATALLRAAGAGPTVIVSPLLSLMRNQVEAAARAGVRAHTVNSGNVTEWQEVRARLAAGEVDVLLVSPERLNNPDFRESWLPELARGIGLLVVDEAHCVSDWGHDFRPDYRRIRDLLASLPQGTPVLATTATANARVVTDVTEQLAVSADGPGREVVTLRGPLGRDSLRLGVLQLAGPDRLPWLAEHLGDLPGSGIVYTLTVAQATDVAEALRAAGHEVRAYSGRSDTDERVELERALLDNRVKALVATSALGMGFDKPDLGFVVHLGAPDSPIAYYQQVGRAGRAVEHADVLLLPGPEDEQIWEWFASMSFPGPHSVERVLGVLASAPGPVSTPALEPRVELRRNKLELLLKVLDVDGAVRRVRGGWVATGEEWHYESARYARVEAARADEQQAMRDYVAGTAVCRMRFLRERLDDPTATDCGRCDVCAGPWYPTTLSGAGRDVLEEVVRRPGVVVEARTSWPTGMGSIGVDVKGRIPEAERAQDGRAVARFTDLGWGAALRRATARDEEGRPVDGPVTDELFGAVTRVLREWGWAERPVAVVSVPSRARPQLVVSLRTRLAEVGRLQDLGELELRHGGPSGGAGGNSAVRLAGVWERLGVPASTAASIDGLSGPVLLVDDVVDSRWTLTVAARELRLAGARAVLPLALGTAG
ncbi:RecQ family ATP-dependent DNA helicase [Aquipuribacter hungaricus]|uniref:DNA 3'-5' helicase n=1 Tax=Aquipuribacter hungaricus TaxID=545624 RepID=A0ABV7WGG6_9MICO